MSEGEPKAGICVPVPVYPLYTAVAAEFGAMPVSSHYLMLGLQLPFSLPSPSFFPLCGCLLCDSLKTCGPLKVFSHLALASVFASVLASSVTLCQW